jgi:hypothetical protein
VEPGIRTIEVERDDDGSPTRIWIVFGPHYFIELRRSQGDRVTFVLGATHHGFKADASEIGGELEALINEVRNAHPEAAVD